MKALIQQRASELGFDDCRFTSAEPPVSAARFEQWLRSGCHGEMGYLHRNAHKRVDPQKVLAGARSIITLAASYGQPAAPSPHPTPPEQAAPQRGVVARYARYADYHDILGQRLERLTQYLRDLGGPAARSLWYVDTGPLLERDLTQRSGLGFVGKHTNLISRQLGNWFFLAEIITTLELEPDPPEHNRCGSCARCLAACPTQAITAPFRLDARLCLSYLTIELKGPIPLELRSRLGNRIFGCDDCLAACPWNRFARQGRLMRPYGRADLEVPDLLELLALDTVQFRERFKGTPILRLKRRGLLRNVCVALGNIGTSQALPALRRASTDPEPLIAEHARWAIKQIDTRESNSLNPAPNRSRAAD